MTIKTSSVDELLNELGVQAEQQGLEKSASAVTDEDLGKVWNSIIAEPYSEDDNMDVNDYQKMAHTEEVLNKMAWAAASDSFEQEEIEFQKQSGAVYVRGIHDGYMAKQAELQGAPANAQIGTDVGNPNAKTTVMSPAMGKVPYGTNILTATGGSNTAPAAPGQVIATGKNPFQAAQTTGFAPGQFRQ